MKLVITPMEKKVDQLLPHKIEVGGKKVGELEPAIHAGKVTWHAVLKLGSEYDGVGLVMGHGPDHESAIANAINRGRKEAIEKLRLVDEFAAAIDAE